MSADTIALSLNEVETQAAKAARGAGFGWGQAEDVGRAARWLSARNIDWSGPLLRLLLSAQGQKTLNDTLAVADRVAGAGIGEGWATAPVEMIWLLPVLSAAIHGHDKVVSVLRGEWTVRLRPDGGVDMNRRPFDLAEGPPASVALAISRPDAALPLAEAIEPRRRRAVIPLTHWHALDAFAARTYVPASDASRIRGAGGGAGLDGD